MTNQNILELLEATLGANQDKVPAPTDGSITSFLFPTQADFDVSYVNVADVAAAMGPVSNDQAGYVGSPLKPGDFTPLLNTFQSLNAWPTFIDLDGTNAAIPKLPSPPGSGHAGGRAGVLAAILFATSVGRLFLPRLRRKPADNLAGLATTVETCASAATLRMRAIRDLCSSRLPRYSVPAIRNDRFHGIDELVFKGLLNSETRNSSRAITEAVPAICYAAYLRRSI